MSRNIPVNIDRNQKIEDWSSCLRSFSSLQPSSYGDPVPIVASDSWSWLTKVEPSVVFHCGSPFMVRYAEHSEMLTMIVRIGYLTYQIDRQILIFAHYLPLIPLNL